jgi:hypothetical protein
MGVDNTNDEALSAMCRMLERDNKKLREAGMALSKAAIHVVENYDGLHRLANAIAGWYIAISNQGDRDKSEEKV